MKNILRLLPFVIALPMLFVACEKDKDDTDISFLSDIRPLYFDNLNFESAIVRSETADFMVSLAETYTELEKEYEAGMFTGEEDLENMRLAGMYYSFYLLAITGNYLDGNLTFDEINGGREQGYYSGLPATAPDFEQQEMEALMIRAKDVGWLATSVNGFNDKSYGFYLSVRQVQERLRTPDHTNSPIIQDSVLNYVFTRLVNYDLLPDWNVLMSMVTFTNYADSLNQFINPAFDQLLFNVNARLVPGALADLGGLYPEMLGPLYRFDLNLKKINWLFDTGGELDEKELEDLSDYITTLETASAFVEEEQADLLNSWPYFSTFEERKVKMEEVKDYQQSLLNGSSGTPRPTLAPYLNSKDFKKAYQCYSCHKTAEL